MKLNELVEHLCLTVEDYFFDFYDIPGGIPFSNPMWAIENPKKTKRLFILESNTYEDICDVTMTLKLTKGNIEVFEKLKKASFYFIVKIKDETPDRVYIPEEVFVSLDEAIEFAKEFFEE